MKRIDINESKEMVLSELKKNRIMTNAEISKACGFSKYKSSKICVLLCEDGLIFRKRGNHSAINFIDKTECENHRTIYEQIIDACDKPTPINKILETIGKEVTQKNRNWLRGCLNNLCFAKKLKRLAIFGKPAFQKTVKAKQYPKLPPKKRDNLAILNTVSELLMMADDHLFIKQLATAIDQKPQAYFTGHTKTLPEYYAQIRQIRPQKPQSKLSRVISTVKTKGDQLKLNEHLTYKSPEYFKSTPVNQIESEYKLRRAPLPQFMGAGEIRPEIGNHRDNGLNAGFFY